MRAEGVDPRDIEWERDAPVYRVYFWHHPDPPPGIRPEEMGWECDEQRLTGVTDVHEVITWANERLPVGDRYVLYVEQADEGRPGLIRLAGTDPTQGEEPGFTITVELPE